MAERLVTKYKRMELDLESHQLQECMLRFHDFQPHARVFENGDTEILLKDEGKELPLSFRNLGTHYRFEGSYTIKNWKLAHSIQRAIRDYKGTALVHRVYQGYLVEYQYEYGQVTLIREHKGNQQKIIYQGKQQTSVLDQLFRQQGVERQIIRVKEQIDLLLDQRNKGNKHEIGFIDQQLLTLSKELFILEA